MTKMLIGRAYITLALALSVTLAAFAAIVAWPLAVAHLFVAGALAWAYLRPMELEVSEEIQRRAR